MTGDRDDDPRGRPWHERTSTVVGASIAGLAAIGLLFLLVSYVSTGNNQPDQAPQYFVDEPTASSAAISSSATTTTQTVTSTSPPVTTDINPSGGTTTSSSDTSTSDTTTTRRTRDTNSGEPSTTRSRPRLNETRTLYPRP